MKVYNYNPYTLDFVGISDSDESPLEPGVFLIPAHATTIEPPYFVSTDQRCRFIDGEWKLENRD